MSITNPNLESIGASSINKQPLPNNKIQKGRIKDKTRRENENNKKLRFLNDTRLVDPNTEMEVKKTLNDRDQQIIESLLKNCKDISAEEAMHTPYAHYRSAS